MPPKPVNKAEAQNPLILRCNRLMEAFAKSDDERDFFLDRMEGFIIYVELDKPQEELTALEKTLKDHPERFVMIPKLTFYETKKIMEGFVNEKVYDIDTKEKLLEIIQSKEARENFLEFIFDHHSELEKWQQYYQERSRIRIIEWLRQNHFEFVFEEDLDLSRDVLEKVKVQLFEAKVGKDVASARKTLVAKSKTYYSNEALNPRPKRGRPPKQVTKQEVEPTVTSDMYTTVTPEVRPFLFQPDSSSSTGIFFSPKFETEAQMMARRKAPVGNDYELSIESFNQKLTALRSLSSRWVKEEESVKNTSKFSVDDVEVEELSGYEEDESIFDLSKAPEEEETMVAAKKAVKTAKRKPAAKKPVAKKTVRKTAAKKTVAKKPAAKKVAAKKPVARKTVKKAAAKKTVARKPAAKKVAAKKSTAKKAAK